MPEILSLELNHHRKNRAKVVKTLIPTIEYYREAGFYLHDIYHDLHNKGHIDASFEAFKRAYYRLRSVQYPKMRTNQREEAETKSREIVVPRPPLSQAKEPVLSQAKQSRESSKKGRGIELGMSFEEHQAIAKEYFDRSRSN